MVYDAFLFFNELELLELRLELLYHKVDKFIISECDYTFSGNKKPLYYYENRHRFSKYKDKIIYVMNTNTDDISAIPDEVRNSPVVDYGSPVWCREWLQREYVKKGMLGCGEGDIIITSDLDEIPDPDKIPVEVDRAYAMRQNNMIYRSNWKNTSEVWVGPQIVPFHMIQDYTINELRGMRFDMNIIDGGWHLTYMGGADRIKNKIKSYSHQEFNNEYTLNSVDSRVGNMKDVLGRNIRIEECDMSIYPEKARNILSKYNI